jgi:hypothetical protein
VAFFGGLIAWIVNVITDSSRPRLRLATQRTVGHRKNVLRRFTSKTNFM